MGNSTLSVRLSLSGVQQVQAGIQSITRSVKTLAMEAAGVAAAYLAIGKLGDTIRDTLDIGRTLATQRNAIGMSIRDLVSLRRELRAIGEDQNSVGLMLMRMQRNISDAAQGVSVSSGSVAMSLHKLFGDNLGKLTAMNAGAQFRAVGEAISALENPAERVARTLEIFGRGTGNMAEMFSHGASGFRAIFDQEPQFGAAMSRSASMIRDIAAALQNLGLNGVRFVTGFLDQVGPMFTGFVSRLNNIDLTPLGQKFGALVGVIVQSWRDGRFPEMIGLLVEAGFELGVSGAKRALSGFVAFINSTFLANMGGVAMNGLMTLGVRAAQLLLKVIEPVTVSVAGFTSWVYDQFREKFQLIGLLLKDIFATAINFWAEKFEWLVNKTIDGLNKIGGYFHAGAMGHVSLGRASDTTTGEVDGVRKAVTLQQAFNLNYERYQDLSKDVTGYLERQLSAARSALDIGVKVTANDNTRLTALQRLKALMDAMLSKRSAKGEGAGASPPGGFPQIGDMGLSKIDDDILQKRRELVAAGERLAKVEDDFTLDAVQKWSLRRDALEQEKKLTEAIIADMEKKVAVLRKTQPQRADLVEGQITGEQQKLVGITKEQGKLGADPNSFGQQWTSTLARLRTEWGTWAEQLSHSFESVFRGAIDSVANGLTAVIMRTKSWGQALYEIGQQILTSIVSAIVKMGVQWIATRLMMAVAGKAIAASSMAALAPVAAAQAAIWAVPATLATIASYGGAAAAAPGEIAASEGVVVGTSFATGGYTGQGGKWQPAGVVHKGEYVFDSESVSRIGLANLEAIRRGGGDVQSGGEVHVHVYHGHESVMAALQSSQGQHHIIETIGKNQHRIIRRG